MNNKILLTKLINYQNLMFA